MPHELYGFHNGKNSPCQKLSRWKYARGKLNRPKSRETKLRPASKILGKVTTTSSPSNNANRPAVSHSATLLLLLLSAVSISHMEWCILEQLDDAAHLKGTLNGDSIGWR